MQILLGNIFICTEIKEVLAVRVFFPLSSSKQGKNRTNAPFLSFNLNIYFVLFLRFALEDVFASEVARSLCTIDFVVGFIQVILSLFSECYNITIYRVLITARTLA